MTTSTSTPPQARVRYNRVAAAGAWLVGVFFTHQLLVRLGPGPVAALIIAIGGQALLTIAQRPLWRWVFRRKGARFALFGVGVTIVDGLVNAGGIYPYVPRLADTDTAKMLVESFSLSPNISNQAALILAFALGLLVAGFPEYLWEMPE